MSSETPLTSGQVSQFVLFGNVIGVCAPLFIRSTYYAIKEPKSRFIRILKGVMTFFMLVKTSLFIAMAAPNGANCRALGLSADIFYHTSMVAGAGVLFKRIEAVISFQYKSQIRILHYLIMATRFIVGMVDVGLVHVSPSTSGSCDYLDMHVIGIIYTTLDTAIDFYATCIICLVLTRHMRKLNKEGLIAVNAQQYFAIVIYNCTRTTLLTIVNLIAAIGIASNLGNRYFIPLVSTLWPITNLLFVSLIGYDTDLTEVIRNMQNRFQDKSANLFDLALPPLAESSPNRSPDTVM
ncbi:uncharacterized protein BX664DRAFT_335704 [Halteromyces radiatus]|uniref:uncharacterized protein n=1 Tax=Halteromyces radiatus TaxID=101107 RepID=UPI00222096B7|nr:uncharacterized protein BX664DRAFT_335704 [Halteromyces radiatus]KAI8086402.1 hypothetical protein BX664DRAFT_335704 [Halteromyces radiatus]